MDKETKTTSKGHLANKRTQLGLPPVVPRSSPKEASQAKLKPKALHKSFAPDDPEFETMDTMAPKPIVPMTDPPEETVTPVVISETMSKQRDDTPAVVVVEASPRLEASDPDVSQEAPPPLGQMISERTEALEGAPPIPGPDADLLDFTVTPITESPGPSETPRPKLLKPLMFAMLAVTLMGLLISAVVFFYSGRNHVPPARAVSGHPSSQRPNGNKTPAAPPVMATPAPPMPSPPKAVTAPIEQVLAAAPAAINKSATEPPTAPPPEPAPPEKETVAPVEKSDEPSEPAPPEKETVAPVEESDVVVITLTGVPKGAAVLLNGEPSQKIFTVPRSQKALKVEVILSGYENAVRRVVPGQDKSLRIHMEAQEAQ